MRRGLQTLLAAIVVVSAQVSLGLPVVFAQRAGPPEMDAKCLPPRIPAMESMILVQDRLIRAPLEGFGLDHVDTIPALQRTVTLKVGQDRSGQETWQHRIYFFFFVQSSSDSTEDTEFVLAAVNDRLVTGEDTPWIDPGVINNFGHVRARRSQSCLWVRQDRRRELPERESPEDANGMRI